MQKENSQNQRNTEVCRLTPCIVYTGIFWLIIHINRIFKWAITISLILDIYISKSVKNNSLLLKAMVGSYLLTVLPAISESILLCIKIEGPGLDKRLGWQRVYVAFTKSWLNPSTTLAGCGSMPVTLALGKRRGKVSLSYNSEFEVFWDRETDREKRQKDRKRETEAETEKTNE